uniref:Perlucin-like protein n=1 Tax=Crassostrea virginica TaxID=6565 RepID=A0A8B8D6J9_CRAVI|nr:perlucin-like protein [Crassostrea virginica]
MRFLSVCTVCVLCTLAVSSKDADESVQNEGVLMKNISDLHFQLFSSIQKKTKMIKTAVFETQCSGSGCTFNGCESSVSDTCDGQMIQKLNKIQSSIYNIWKRKPKDFACKTGWKRYQDHCYFLYSTKMNWFEAQVFCRKHGTVLVQINDAKENAWVSKTFPEVKYWMDYTDNGMEGKWVSFSTGKSDYSNWFKGEPNNKRGKQHCALNNHGKRGFWDDGTCSYQRQFMCEASGSEF